MKIPNFIDSQIVDKEGYLTDIWKQVLMQLIAQLQINLSDEGYVVPSQNNSNVTLLNTTKYTGAILYNSQINKFMGNVSGTYIPFAMTGAPASFSGVQITSLSPNTALISDVSQNIISSITSDVELSYVHGVTSNIQSQLNNKESIITAGTSSQYWRGDKTWQTLNTSVVPENTNLYYTDTRARAAISASAIGLTYTSGTGVLSLTAGYVIAFMYTDFTTHGSVNAAATNLATYNLLANALYVDGSYIDIHGFGRFAANDNNKSVQLYIGSTLILDTLVLPLNDGTWDMRVIFARITTATQKVTILAASSNLALIAKSFFVSTTEDLTSNVLIRFVGTGVVSNDVTQEGLICKVMG